MRYLVGRYLDLTPAPSRAPQGTPPAFIPVVCPPLQIQESHRKDPGATLNPFRNVGGKRESTVLSGANTNVNKLHRNFKWLPWYQGDISETDLTCDVLAGPMSGCILVSYRDAAGSGKMGIWLAKIAAPVSGFDSSRERGLLSGTRMRSTIPVPRAVQRTFLVALAATFCLLSAQSAWALFPHRNSDVRKHIEALEMQWRDAILTHNVRAMDHLLADNYLGISANGTVETKAEELAQCRAGTLRIQKLDLSDIKVRVYGKTAVVTSRADLKGVNGQSDISGKYRYTRVYNKHFGHWKIISFEASRMHDADARAQQ